MKMKRWLAMLLCIAQVLALLAVPVFAAESGGSGGPTVATVPNGVTPVTVTAVETKLEAAAWQTNGYAYVAFTAAKDGTYTIFAKGTEDSSEDIQICVDASPQTGNGSGCGEENGTQWYQRTLSFNATESETYTFQIPKFGSSDVYVYVSEGEFGGPGGFMAATMPSGVTPVTVTAEETKLETAAWQTNGYAYVAFTAAKNGTYTVYAKGTSEGEEDIQICVDASPQTGCGSGSGEENGTLRYHRTLTFNATENETYTFQIPKFGSSDVYVYVSEGDFGGGSGSGGPSGPPVATVPNGVTPVTVNAEEKKLETAAWQTNGYAYVTFTAAKDGTYTIFAKGTEASGEGIQICVDASPQTGSGSGHDADAGLYENHLTFNANAGDEYIFQIPKFGSSDVYVYVSEGGFGGPGGPGGSTVATVPNGVTPVTVAEEETKLETAAWQTNGYAYVAFTATQDGTYTILAKGTEDNNEGIQICVDASPQTGDGSGGSMENGTQWYHRTLTFIATENETYTFQIPKFGSSDVYVCVNQTGPAPLPSLPQGVTPVVLTATNQTITFADEAGKTANEYAYVQFTPTEDGFYEIAAKGTTASGSENALSVVECEAQPGYDRICEPQSNLYGKTVHAEVTMYLLGNQTYVFQLKAKKNDVSGVTANVEKVSIKDTLIQTMDVNGDGLFAPWTYVGNKLITSISASNPVCNEAGITIDDISGGLGWWKVNGIENMTVGTVIPVTFDVKLADVNGQAITDQLTYNIKIVDTDPQTEVLYVKTTSNGNTQYSRSCEFATQSLTFGLSLYDFENDTYVDFDDSNTSVAYYQNNVGSVLNITPNGTEWTVTATEQISGYLNINHNGNFYQLYINGYASSVNGGTGNQPATGIYFAVTWPDGRTTYEQGFGFQYIYPQIFGLVYYDGTNYTTLTENDVQLDCLYNDGNQFVTDSNKEYMEYEWTNGQLKLTAKKPFIGGLSVTYGASTKEMLTVLVEGGPEYDETKAGYTDHTTTLNENASVTVDDPKWIENYTFFAFTPTEDATYAIKIDAKKDAGSIANEFHLCGADLSPVVRYDTGWDDETLHAYGYFQLKKDTTYYFQFQSESDRLTDVTVAVERSNENQGTSGGPGGQFTPTADNIYVGGNSPEGIQYAEKLTGTGSYVQGCYLGYYDGTDYKALSTEDVTVVYEIGNDIDGYTSDNGSIVAISSGDNDSWNFEFQRATTGRLAVSYLGKTYYITVQISGIPEPDSTDPVTIVPADGSAITLDNNTTWIDEMGVYTYLSFTPSEDGTYTIHAEATRKDTGMISSGMELCGDEFMVVKSQGGAASDDSWTANGVYTMTAGTTYYIKLISEPDRLNTITVTGKLSNGSGYPYNVPRLVWPAAGSAEEGKILTAIIDGGQVKVNNNLVTLTDDWYGVNFTVTPTTSGVYELDLDIPGGYLNDPTDKLMIQTARCVQTTDWVTGGHIVKQQNAADIQMWDRFNLEAGKTYQFQFLVCRHGIDASKDVLLQVKSVSLKADNISVDPNGGVYAVISGTYDQKNSDETVTATKNGVTIDATSDETNVTDVTVSIGGSSVESLVENQVSSVTISTDVADVTFDSTALNTINDTGKNVTLSVTVEETESGVLEVELTLVDSDGNPVLPDTAAATNGTVTVTIPYEVPAGKSIQVYYVDDKGNKTRMNARYDEETGLVTFETNHFSLYEIQTVTDPCNGEHTFTKYTETKAATCTEKGSETAICDKCKTVTDTREIAATGHSWDTGKVTKEATCTTDGVKTYSCACGETKTEKISATGHSWDSGKVTKEATCTTDGVKTYSCACGETKTEKIVATGHNYESKVVKPTCTDKGYTLHTCKNCSDSYKDTYTNATGHSWDKGTVTKAPTGSETGVKTYTCKTCGKAKTEEIAKLSNPFTDLVNPSFYYDAVLWAADKGITKGTYETNFSPEEDCTRAQIVTFLWRHAGEPEPTSTEHNFVDLVEDSSYYKAVLWAAEMGITNGMDETHFGPQEPCTRAQAVTFLWRYEGKPTVANRSTKFTDLVEGASYYDAVLWAVEQGITTGADETHFEPVKTCTRAQGMTFLYRYHNTK